MNNDRTLILGLTQSFLNKSQLKSPAMIISLFSSSIFRRNSSKHCRNTIFESGGAGYATGYILVLLAIFDNV